MDPLSSEAYEAINQEPTTADAFDQDYVANQSATGLIDRKMEQGSEMADGSATIASTLSTSQDSMPSDMVGTSVTSQQVSDFLKRPGIDKLLVAAGAMSAKDQELIGDDSPLLDHPDRDWETSTYHVRRHTILRSR